MKSRIAASLAAVALVAACSSQPPAPAWQANAHDSLQRFVAAYLEGDERSATVEFANARRELAATGDPTLVARAELTRCAVRVASLVFEPCTGFDALRADSAAPERAYADYLTGHVAPAEVPLLPPQHRSTAAGREDAGALAAIGDPVARMVAAGVLLRSGRASPPVLQVAVDTASQQGWRRPLLAWLGVQAQRAEHAGAKDEAARIRRRMDLVGGAAPR
jgi:hypothetical protein